MNTRIAYLYRDGANNKQGGEVVLAGALSDEQIADIRHACDDGQWFIPGDVGLPELQAVWVEKGYPLTADDHVWHELVDFEATADSPTLAMTAAAFYERFVSVAHWDVAGAITRIGLG
ncbi:hypothetical protein [Sulfobacillus harzensis]|uniref:Uncharacterized protein n=1 Tax=Sulfobacillus harzensis TaxID=2729629 RepID=A0A7Y0L804_9FIRM|nr:hypothetical protein [Sulfobacillus harzensis]NMP24910.1 hypothetical protein [Sulfobacillus harzensis]